MKEYYEEFDKLDAAEQFGRRAILVYELTRDANFSWEGVTSNDIFVHVINTSINPLANLRISISDEECLRGIDYWVGMRRSAEDWAFDLALEYIGDTSLDIDGIDMSSDSIDAFISEASESADRLWELREDDPLLYGEICLEVSHQLSMLVHRSAPAN